jgi:hypothetical protein
LACFGVTDSSKNTFTSSWSLTWSDQETTQVPRAIRRPSRNMPISTVIVAAIDVERLEVSERPASESTILRRFTPSPGYSVS